MIDTPEKLAENILGKEEYRNAPCQAHPYELIANKFATQQARIESLTEGIKRTTALYNDLENAEIEGDDESCGVIRHQLDRSIEDMAALLEEGE